MNKLLALAAAFFAANLALVGPAAAQATGPDYSSLTSAVDVTSTIAALLSVGAVILTVTLAVMGIRKILRMVRGA